LTTILDQIVARKRFELAAAKAAVPKAQLEARVTAAPSIRSLGQALQNKEAVQVIAEVKKASPSAGTLRADFDPAAIGNIYQASGAAAISVLTDEPFFQGKLGDLTLIRSQAGVPLLRKDFIIDHYQLLEARIAGADAVLLIAEILSDEALPAMVEAAQELGLDPLVEIHDPANLPRALASGARILGVNNRDLHTFETRLEHTFEVTGRVPANTIVVSESGIRSRADVERLAEAGVNAILVGESLMRAADMSAKLKELIGVPRRAAR
jgi:indole-3-glycerol phosphate synthase